VQDGIQQRIANVNLAVVVDEPKCSKLVHEEADARAGGPYHFSQRSLIHFNSDGVRDALFAKMGENQ